MDANFPRMWADRLLVPARPVGTGDRQPARRGLGGLHGQRPAAGTATTTSSVVAARHPALATTPTTTTTTSKGREREQKRIVEIGIRLERRIRRR